jgi:hypothetical protein
MLSKIEILSELRRIATMQSGALSYRKFIAISGLSETYFKGRFWATWSEALEEAGLAKNSFSTPRTDESVVVSALVQLIQQLGTWPSETQLMVQRNKDTAFPGVCVFRRLGKEVSLPAKVVSYCTDSAEFLAVKAIAQEKLEASREATEQVGSNPIAGYVYMMRSGKRYKIGKSNSPSRRFREVRLDLPDETLLVHTIPTDDPSGIEAYWHRRFSSKRVRDTEFFELVASDVSAFKRRKYQ